MLDFMPTVASNTGSIYIFWALFHSIFELIPGPSPGIPFYIQTNISTQPSRNQPISLEVCQAVCTIMFRFPSRPRLRIWAYHEWWLQLTGTPFSNRSEAAPSLYPDSEVAAGTTGGRCGPNLQREPCCGSNQLPSPMWLLAVCRCGNRCDCRQSAKSFEDIAPSLFPLNIEEICSEGEHCI